MRYLIISRMAVSHHGSAPWIMHSRSSGKRTHTRSRWIGFCTSPGIGGPGMPGVEAQRQVELAALRVERVVDGVARRVHAVAPEARARRWRRRPGGRATNDSSDRSVGIGRSRLRPPTPRAKRSGRCLDEPLRPVGSLVPSSRVIRMARSTPLASMSSSSSGSSRAREERLAALEVVLLDADHPLRLRRRRPGPRSPGSRWPAARWRQRRPRRVTAPGRPEPAARRTPPAPPPCRRWPP